MRSLLSGIFLVVLALAVSGQQTNRIGHVPLHILELRSSGVRFAPVNLLRSVVPNDKTDELWSDACRSAQVLSYDHAAAAALIAAHPDHIALSLPTANGIVVLDLERTSAITDDLVVRQASDGRTVQPEASVHYKGMVQGDANSLVSISVFQREVMGLISDDSGEQVIGRFDRAPGDLHVLYHERDLRRTSGAVCGTPDSPGVYGHDELQDGPGDRSIRCVRWYWEVGNDIFLNKGSVLNATNYVTGLFNQSATLYANDGISVSLLEVFVWDVASPYNGTSSSSRLSQFGTTRTSFNGDMAHLLDNGGYGGVAWLNTLCAGTSSRMAYSGINNSYNNVPTYSWSVEVVTHEQGHNLGSRHTHACAWNGNGTAIDGCGPTAGYTEGSCPTAPNPTGGGTIMSYCHLVGGVGINFNNGFGPQPKAVILNAVNGATCLLSCGTSCDPPGLSVSALTPVSCTLNWTNTGAVSYTMRWKPQASGTWTTVTGLTTTSYALTGLTQTTAYEFQVQTVCAASSSAYSASYNFSTPAPCPDANEPNNSLAAAVVITPPTAINALIASASDQDFYKFTTTGGTVNLYLSNVAGDYDLYLLSSTGTQLAASELGGTSSESINYTAAAGTYVIKVIGYNGAFSAFQCYALNLSVYQACGPVSGYTATAITYNSALLGWNAIPTATSYELQWKSTAGSTWTTVTGITTNSCTLGSLAASTSYDFKVRPICQGSQSVYEATSGFTTTGAPCEVAPPILLSMKVLLEGPYRTANGLMTDSLRVKGLIPLTEPYGALGLAVTGATSITSGVLAVAGNNAIVDWVVVELRNPASMSAVVERKAALLQRDGDVVALDGTSALGFCSAAGSYHVAVRHRNHQGCMTVLGITLGNTATSVDLTASGTGTYGTNARKQVGTVMALWMGNATGDTMLMYTGAGNDRDPILTAVGSTTPNNSVTGYLRTDLTLDGQVKYTGSENDRDPILTNVGSTTPNNVRVEQLP
jgi:hypothetical protein